MKIEKLRAEAAFALGYMQEEPHWFLDGQSGHNEYMVEGGDRDYRSYLEGLVTALSVFDGCTKEEARITLMAGLLDD